VVDWPGGGLSRYEDNRAQLANKEQLKSAEQGTRGGGLFLMRKELATKGDGLVHAERRGGMRQSKSV